MGNVAFVCYTGHVAQVHRIAKNESKFAHNSPKTSSQFSSSLSLPVRLIVVYTQCLNASSFRVFDFFKWQLHTFHIFLLSKLVLNEWTWITFQCIDHWQRYMWNEIEYSTVQYHVFSHISYTYNRHSLSINFRNESVIFEPMCWKLTIIHKIRPAKEKSHIHMLICG